VRGPVGDRLVWRPDQPEPAQLIAGGSGIVPLMAIIGATPRQAAKHRCGCCTFGAPARVGHLPREVQRRVNRAAQVSVTYAFTRSGPSARRVGDRLIATATWPPDLAPTCYISCPAGFADTITGLLIAANHHPSRPRTEPFAGP
jgi:ferredoxin-NADP reductase